MQTLPFNPRWLAALEETTAASVILFKSLQEHKGLYVALDPSWQHCPGVYLSPQWLLGVQTCTEATRGSTTPPRGRRALV